MTFLHPGWLALALTLPLIWWLHRGRRTAPERLVASLAPFRTPAVVAPGATRVARPADPAWRRRALIALLLGLALAAPRLGLPSTEVTVWVDGDVSLDTLEAGATRLARALAALDDALAGRRASTVRIRGLAAPQASFAWTRPGDAAALLGRLPRGAPGLPDPAVLDDGAEHWLVTDGANAAVARFAASAALTRLIRVGAATENAGITALVARGALGAARATDVDVTVANAGLHPTRRVLELDADARPVARTALTLGAGAHATLHFALEGAPRELRAGLGAADPLAADDQLVLRPTPPLATIVAVDPACGPALGAAVRAASGPTTAAAAGADLVVDCSGAFAATAGARLLLRRPTTPRALFDVHWNAREVAVAGAPLPARLFGAEASDAPESGDAVLLAAGLRPLVVRRAAGPLVVDLDLEDPRVTHDEAYAPLIARLLALALGRELVAPLRQSLRAPASLRIAPYPLPATGRAPPRAGRRPLDPGAGLVLAALALLLRDTLPLLVRRRAAAAAARA